jgi:predicted N-acetyltransferase YhbS
VLIRPVRPEEHERLGALTLAAYHSLPGHVHEPAYDAQLADIAAKLAAGCEVMVAVREPDGTVVGDVCFVPSPQNPFHDAGDPEALCFRHLAVDPAAQGGGAGRALTQWCIDRARQLGATRLLIHSTPWMTGAHHLYESMGFVRAPEHDWLPEPEIPLLGFVLTREPPAGT